MIKNLEELYQKERDNYNKLAKKYNEKEKEQKVSVPGFQVSITTHKTKKTHSKLLLSIKQRNRIG